MRAFVKGLATSSSFVALGIVWVVGCSADGGSDGLGESAPVEPTEETASLQPPSESGEQDASTSSPSKADAGKKDAAPQDAGPPPPEPGDSCTTQDALASRPCGACGTQQTICQAGDGGALQWSDYGFCQGEVAGGCVPNTVEQVACGNCGTATRTCSKYCAWTTSSCSGQPVDSCSPGSVDFSTAGCGANTYKTRSCQNSCTWNSFSLSCESPSTTVKVGATVGSVSSTIAVLASTSTTKRLGGICPNATISSTVTTPSLYLKVQNPNAKAATVSIYNSQAPGGAVVKTVLAAYDGATDPATDAARQACTKGVSSYGTSSLTGNSSFASLDGTRQVTIPANGTATIYMAAYYAFDATKPGESTGPVKFSVRTDALAQ